MSLVHRLPDVPSIVHRLPDVPSIVHRLPRELRRLVGSFVDDLRPLRRVVRRWSPRGIELDVLTDRNQLEMFMLVLQTNDYAHPNLAHSYLHDAIVHCRSPVLWTLLSNRQRVEPLHIVRLALEHHVDPSLIFKFVDPFYASSADTTANLESAFVQLLFTPHPGEDRCSYRYRCQVTRDTKLHVEYSVTIVKHYVNERFKERLWDHLGSITKVEFSLAALAALVEQNVYTKSYFIPWLRQQLNDLTNYRVYYFKRLQRLYKWATT